VSASEIGWIIVLALVVIVLIGMAGYLMNRKKAEQNRARARDLRLEASSGATVIPDAQVKAQEAEARAERARLEAERAEAEAALANSSLIAEQAQYEDRIREADRLDPDVDHRSSGYSPDTATAAVEEPTYDASGRVEPESDGTTVSPASTEPGSTALDDDQGQVNPGAGSHRA
jgi:hypothetical protein